MADAVDQNSGGQPDGQNQSGQLPQGQAGGGSSALGVDTGSPAASPSPTGVSWEALRALIPAEYAKEKVWDAIKDVPTLLKNYAEAQRYNIGAVKMPKADAPPKEWDAFYAKLGRPESPDGYELALDATVPWDDALVGKFRQWAHRAGLSPQQAQRILDDYAETVKESVRGRLQARETLYQHLKETYGPAYEKELAYGQAAVKQLGGERVIQLINETGIGNDPEFVKMFIKIGRALAEDSIIDVEAIRNSERDAQARIDQIMADKSHAYWDRTNPAHDRAVEEVNRLFGMLYPNQTA